MNRAENSTGTNLSGLPDDVLLDFCKARSFALNSYMFGKSEVEFHTFTGVVLSPERREREKILSNYGQHPGLDSHRLYVTSKTEVDSHFWLFDPLAGEIEIDLPKLDISVREGQLVTIVYAAASVSRFFRKPDTEAMVVGLVNHSTQQRYALASASEIRNQFKLRDHWNIPTIATLFAVLGAWIGSFAVEDQGLIMFTGAVALLYALMARLYLLFQTSSLLVLGFTFDWPMFYLTHKSGLENLLNQHLAKLAEP